MTTIVRFTPSPTGPFVFQPTLDGNVYTASVKWLGAGQRWYIELEDLSGTTIFYLPLIGSPTGIAIETLTWSGNQAEATTSEPHGYVIGDVVDLTISGATPDAYNGLQECFITGPSTFIYDLIPYPGPTSVPGTASYDINIAGGYFEESTLVFREDAQQFEISP